MKTESIVELIVRFLMFVIPVYIFIYGISLCLEMDKLVELTNKRLQK